MTPVEKMYLWFMFVAYAGLFLLMFAFVFKMLHKSRQLEADVRRLEEQWEPQNGESIRTTVPPAVTPNVPGQEL